MSAAEGWLTHVDDRRVARARTKDDLCTPAWISDLVWARVSPISLDPCSNEWTRVRAWLRYSIDDGDNGLTLPWATDLAFVNPPYSRGQLRLWQAKAEHELASGRCRQVIALVPTRPSTKAFQAWTKIAAARVDLARRVRFEGGAHGSGLFDSTIWYAGPLADAFVNAFESFGEIIRYARGTR